MSKITHNDIVDLASNFKFRSKEYNLIEKLADFYFITNQSQIKTTCPNCFVKLTFQLPQLSDDVEEALQAQATIKGGQQ